jgi:glycosyltransferase involved in cell wall biosynthesis
MLLSEDVGKDRESVLKFFRIADVFALPSYIEGVPISLLEAMSLGIPSISTNVYGIPEAIINEKTGLMIEPGRAQDLAAAVLRLFHDAGLRERLANAGRQHAVANFDERDAARIAVSEYVAAAAANQLRQASQRQ